MPLTNKQQNLLDQIESNTVSTFIDVLHEAQRRLLSGFDDVAEDLSDTLNELVAKEKLSQVDAESFFNTQMKANLDYLKENFFEDEYVFQDKIKHYQGKIVFTDSAKSK